MTSTLDLTLVIGNKNYSSWSMRPWVLLKQFNIPFEERLLHFSTPEWNAHIATLSPSGLVPALWLGRPVTGEVIYESLAIIEAIADLFPNKPIWPRDRAARAHARSISAEIHGGFTALRSAMSMNIRAPLAGKGHTAAALKDVARIEHLWETAHERFGQGGPYLFGEFSAADAMFAPVVTRFQTYSPPLSESARLYCQTMLATPGVSAWIVDALKETEFVVDHEDYQSAINQLK